MWRVLQTNTNYKLFNFERSIGPSSETSHGPYWILRDLGHPASKSQESLMFSLSIASKGIEQTVDAGDFRLHGIYVTSLSGGVGTEVSFLCSVTLEVGMREIQLLPLHSLHKGPVIWCFCDVNSKCWTNTLVANHLRCHATHGAFL